ncbi:MAG: 50S ribosomal protein L25/general stress protein Ctc [Verrucomicrobia bacterium]|nr:50S ribosomal protein L25/general stress protein Ctc [Verrucomicrobiota bacterium]
MKLTANVRTTSKKSETKQLRRDGKIPAVLYSAGQATQQIIIDADQFNAVLRNMKPGRLPTTTFSLMIDGTEKKAIIKDIQYQLTSYRVSHIDFEELFSEIPVSVKVPIQCTGVAECAGIKLGGFLRQVKRHVKVECLPKHIPSEFTIDVTDLGIKQAKKLSDISMPEGVVPHAKMDEVVVVISKRAGG